MKFGKVDNPEEIDFTLPADHMDTKRVFNQAKGSVEMPRIYVGLTRWSKQDLKNFYPRGTKDDLAYYASQFNAIELNATYYRIFPPEQCEKWKEKTPDNFRFFPKLPKEISHERQLQNVEAFVDYHLHSVSHLGTRLSTSFLQMHEAFGPEQFEVLRKFVEFWPDEFPLTVELRHTHWHNDLTAADELQSLLEENGVSSTIVDTGGRRDLIHMRMPTVIPFIRYVGTNHESDYKRLDDWVERIATWVEQGMSELQFCVHQNMEQESPLLAAYFVKKINQRLCLKVHVPTCLKEASTVIGTQGDLFS